MIPHIFKHFAGFAGENVGLKERINNLHSVDDLNGGNMHRRGQTQRVKMQ
jgi:hypothetical protein